MRRLILLFILLSSCAEEEVKSDLDISETTQIDSDYEDDSLWTPPSNAFLSMTKIEGLDYNFAIDPSWEIPTETFTITITNNPSLNIEEMRENRLYEKLKTQIFDSYKDNAVLLTVDTLKEYFEQGIKLDDPRAMKYDNMSPFVGLLNTSVYNANDKLIKYALKNTKNLNMGNVSPLCTEKAVDNMSLYKRLIKQGADVNFRSANHYIYQTPLQYASSMFKIKVVQLLLKEGVAVNNVVPVVCSIKMLDLLIENGLDINHQDSKGRTVLYHALWKNNEPLTRYLVETKKADITLISYDQYDPWRLQRMTNEYVVSVLKEISTQPKHIFYAISNNQLENLQSLLKNLENIDITNANGDTPLLMMAKQKTNMLPFVKIALAEGANPNHKNKFGWTAFHITVKENNVRLAKYFLDLENFDPTIANHYGQSPLDTAKIYKRNTIISWLDPEANEQTE